MKEPEKSVAETLLTSSSFYIVIFCAAFSSIASYFLLLAKGKKHSMISFISRFSAAMLAGFLSYLIGEKFDLGLEYSCLLSSVAGWAGPETMIFLENLLKNWATNHVEHEKSLFRIVRETLADQVKASRREVKNKD